MEALPGGARYVLPRGSALRRCRAGLGHFFFGVLIQAVLGTTLWLVSVFATPNNLRGIAGFLWILFGVGMFFLSWVPMWKAIRALFGRPMIECGGGRVRVGQSVLGLRTALSGTDLPLREIDVVSLGPREWELLLTFWDGETVATGTGLPEGVLNEVRRLLRERHLVVRAPAPPPSAPRPAPVPGRPGTGITFLPDAAPAPAKGECQVCGTPMTSALVACASCKTLHHKACWDYMRRCSTYACRGTRSLPATR